MHDIAEFLGGRDPFSGLDEGALEALAARTEVGFFPAGTTIIPQGEIPQGRIRVVRRGAVDLLDRGKPVDLLGEGEMFGHPSVLSGLPTKFEVRAHEDTLCYSLAAEDVVPLLGRSSSLRYLTRSLIARGGQTGDGEAIAPSPEVAQQPAAALVRRPPLICNAETTLREAARLMDKQDVSSVLVELGHGEFGIVTDSDLRFVRLHVRVLGAVLACVVLGVLVDPGLAFSGAEGGRLAGVIWPVPPTQVGEYGAVAAGLVALLWLTHTLDGRSALTNLAPAMACLLLSHTRTALLGFLVALPVAGLTLVLTSARARRAIGLGICLAGFAALALPDVLMNWFNRDQSPDQIADLTGRQKVWDALLARERTPTEQMLGIGLSNKSYDGLPIDSTWLSTYHELGEIGVGVVVLMLASLLIVALLRPPSVARRCAVFLIVYCIVASYTEVGLGDASPYLLHLALAASLLLAPGATRNESNSSAREQQETTGPTPVP